VPNARRIGRIIGSDSTSHFTTPESHGNVSEIRKLPYDSKPRDIERRLYACEQVLERQRRKGFLHRIVTEENEFITITPSAANHRDFSVMLPRRRPN